MTTAPPVAEDRDDDRMEAAIRGVLRLTNAWDRPPRSVYETWARCHRSLIALQMMPPCHRTYTFVRGRLRHIAATAILEAMRGPAAPDELRIPESEPGHLERRRSLLDEALGDPGGWAPGAPIRGVDEALGALGFWLARVLCTGGRTDEADAASYLAQAAVRILAEIPGLAGADGDPLGETVMPNV